jgi:GcrA cell cycle regulator
VANAWDKHWDDAAIALLTELWMSGYSSGECGRALGVSRSAAIGKINRLGLMRRDRPRMPIMARRPVAQLLLKTTEQVSRPPKRPQIPQMRRNKRPLPPPEPYKAPPPPPVPPIGSFGLLDLRAGHCRWPGPQDRAPWTFCGMPQAFGSSYCSAHHAMAHNRGSQRDYDRAAEQALAGKLFASRAGIEQ